MNQEANCEVKYTEVSDSAVMALVPVVSIHMITYNHGQYLAEAIEGVIAQKTDFPIELIIGEDCSTDNTREIALDYQRRYPHLIRVIYSDHNVGMHGNFRRVLDACRGEFIALCEGDDYWINPEKLSEQVAVLSKMTNIDITFHSRYIKYEKKGNIVLSAVPSSIDKVFTLSEVIAGDGDFMSTASILVRRSSIMSIKHWLDGKMIPVIDFFVQVFGSRNGGAYYINKPMCVYRKDVIGSWSETTKQIDRVVEFEKNFFSAVKKLQQEIPGQDKAFYCLIVSHYADRFLSATHENFTQIKELILPVLIDLNILKKMAGQSTELEHLELEYLFKFAVESGKIKDLADHSCGVIWQFMRVVKSLIDSITTISIMIFTDHSESKKFVSTITKWKLEAQKSYLIARYSRLCRLIIENSI